MLYIICYDLCQPKRNYEALKKKLKKFEGCFKLTQSVVLLFTLKELEEIREELFSVLDSDDRLFVARITKNALWKNMIAGDKQLDELFE